MLMSTSTTANGLLRRCHRATACSSHSSHTRVTLLLPPPLLPLFSDLVSDCFFRLSISRSISPLISSGLHISPSLSFVCLVCGLLLVSVACMKGALTFVGYFILITFINQHIYSVYLSFPSLSDFLSFLSYLSSLPVTPLLCSSILI